jgi:hypothetical protein
MDIALGETHLSYHEQKKVYYIYFKWELADSFHADETLIGRGRLLIVTFCDRETSGNIVKLLWNSIGRGSEIRAVCMSDLCMLLRVREFRGRIYI